ncbi:MAG: addiction module protein [Planctomycetota bacterium]
MTHQEVLASIELLPKDVQLAIVSSVLERLSNDGPLEVSEELKAEFIRREEAFFANPTQGEPWQKVREELFGQ